MKFRCAVLQSLLRPLCTLVLCVSVQSVAAADWLPLDPAELAMTEEAKAPQAPAIYLYRQVDRDDVNYSEEIYTRIKILTEEGRKHADVAIPFDKKTESVRGIEARTIRPDGSIARFDGTVYENLIVQGRGVKVLAKTFTLPDVQVGGIIEYRYRHNLRPHYVFDSQWMLSEPLFTRHGKYSIKVSEFYRVRASWPQGLPPNTIPPTNDRGMIRLETHDVAAFVEEEFAPPENQIRFHVDFVYLSDSNMEREPEKYWQKYAKEAFARVDDFVDKPSLMREAVAGIVAPSDTPETKLRKIYARAQRVRNLSYERDLSEAEEKREGIKDAKNVADVWKRGYGDALEVCWLFLGLARAAGFEASPVFTSTRDRYFFNEVAMNMHQLNSAVVQVKLNGALLYLDPGTAYTPFGTLPWYETGVKGLLPAKSGGTWITTPLPEPANSRIVRKAKLNLTREGSLEGKVTVTYTGLEASTRRVRERNEDDVARKEYLEDELEYDIPSGIDAKLTNAPDWSSSETPLVAEYTIRVPGWASMAGQRVLLTMGLFGNGEKRIFKQATRVHPIYFHYPYVNEDEISIELPEGWQAGSMPASQNRDLKVVAYRTSATSSGQSLQVKRELFFNLVLMDSKYYSQLRDFFQTVRTNDEQQIVIGAPRSPSGKEK